MSAVLSVYLDDTVMGKKEDEEAAGGLRLYIFQLSNPSRASLMSRAGSLSPRRRQPTSDKGEPSSCSVSELPQELSSAA